MQIKNGIIFIWSGTNATIPTGWQRVTALDDKFTKGAPAGTDSGAVKGGVSHTHTSPAHGHGMNDHNHLGHAGAGQGGGANADTGSSGPIIAHWHADYWTGGIAGQSISDSTSTYTAASNDPVYYAVIYITPITTCYGLLPAGVISLADKAITNFNVCDGNNGNPNLVGKFLKGASAGADAGATGGSNQNTHAVSHVHACAHYHSSAVTGATQWATAGTQSSGGNTMYWSHTHNTTLGWQYFNTNDDISLTTPETNIEPAYKKLFAIRSTTAIKIPIDIIAMWRGTIAKIPLGWEIYTAMQDKHLKITATLGEVGSTGGSNTHTHAAQNHSHGVWHSGHTSNTDGHGTNRGNSGSGRIIATSATTHPCTVDGNAMYTGVNSTSADSSNNEPLHEEVIYIKLTKRIESANFLFNFM